MKIVSWNVNGLRACAKKGFSAWLDATEADVVGLQEVRALESQLPEDVAAPEGWHTAFSAAERKGYSGVGLYSRHPFEELETSLEVPEFDVEGRVQIALIKGVRIANVYFPNGSGKNRDNSRIPYKLAFYQRLYDVLQPWHEAGVPLVVIGDFNTAHEAIDLARPKSNTKTSGFRAEEREELSRWLSNGWVDSFRLHHPETEGMYTWWSNRPGVRERNVGWRIDYGFLSSSTAQLCTQSWIETDTLGSDHCPIGLELDLANT